MDVRYDGMYAVAGMLVGGWTGADITLWLPMKGGSADSMFGASFLFSC